MPTHQPAGTLVSGGSRGGSGGGVGPAGPASDMLATLTNAEVSVTTTATLTVSKMHVCSGTSANYTVTLPAASGNSDKFIGIRMAPGLTKLVTVDGNASETIDGALTRVMWAAESAILKCDGSNWFKVAGKTRPMECSLSLGTDQGPVATGAPEAIVLLDTTDGDNSGLMADLTNHKIIVPRAGKYRLQSEIVFVPLSGGAQRLFARMYVNASAVASNDGFGYSAGVQTQLALNARGHSLAAGDLVKITLLNVSGVNQSLAGLSSEQQTRLRVEEMPSW